MTFNVTKVHGFGDAVTPALIFYVLFEKKRDQNVSSEAGREETGQTETSKSKEEVLVTQKEGGQRWQPTTAWDSEDTV